MRFFVDYGLQEYMGLSNMYSMLRLLQHSRYFNLDSNEDGRGLACKNPTPSECHRCAHSSHENSWVLISKKKLVNIMNTPQGISIFIVFLSLRHKCAEWVLYDAGSTEGMTQRLHISPIYVISFIFGKLLRKSIQRNW